MFLLANCYPHVWVVGLVALLLMAGGALLIARRDPIARVLVSDFLLGWFRPDPARAERAPTVEVYTRLTSWVLALFGASMIVIPVLAFVGTATCDS
jgi:hypothetical protein